MIARSSMLCVAVAMITSVSCTGGAGTVAEGGRTPPPGPRDGLLWTATDAGTNVTYPAIEDRVVFATGNGMLTAFQEACGVGGATCHAAWSSPPLDDLTWPAATHGQVYVANYSLMDDPARARLFAFDVVCDTGDRTCKPTWTGRIPGGVDFDQGPVISGGSVFVPAVSGLYAFPESCGSPTCTPSWHAFDGREIHALAVTPGEVFAGTEHEVIAFPSSCVSGRTCMSLWRARMGSPPNRIVVTDGVVVVSTIGRKNGSGQDVYGFAATCSTRCSPLWTGQTAGDGGFAAVDGSTVFVEDQQSDVGGIFAFDVRCRTDGGRCRSLWNAPAPNALAHDISVSDGVVYVGTQDGEVYAYPTDCSMPCQSIWSAPAGGRGDWVSPTAADGIVLVGSDRLYAFEAPKT